ncbi:gamma-glutamyl-gamma-aminobutyrate hydrolase family protein [Sphingomonas sp. PL-96]|uniref:gamma-glutamyl-gamma-aminobutyrate hydrolase family protein n=1 Tax=Sphingomonas sp. PL-96 TaxID=2887201 RepID=UPI001E40730F|nr:gamma-glutamyl-gamma-aminobutyrate hydrolase family protein [Sphingomonas sp. PL-96]MCC2975179.1 gamma-glutamyl-gamma-aminobutyrate hydrolase family protein [Sphingomonas sp. PL-96]
METRRPIVGLLCCNELVDRAVQTVATRFLLPLASVSRTSTLLVPAVADTADVQGFAALFDALLLTGSRSHVGPERYGAGPPCPDWPVDPERDEVALALAGRMIEMGKPVFGICRGMQEINVLFGGSLSSEVCRGRHHRGFLPAGEYDRLFQHRHDVELASNGRLATLTGERRLRVNSVHEQAVDRLGAGLSVDAVSADDGIIEAIRGDGCGAEVLGVQWHPEWDVATSTASQAFFKRIGEAARSTNGGN